MVVDLGKKFPEDTIQLGRAYAMRGDSRVSGFPYAICADSLRNSACQLSCLERPLL
jgi:hypothetical protein